ncbi:uncharacterized protein AB675_10232 [Cyphellophora attinorum]|uniref:Methyltransferase domain-containing protein n=1 Tax=Cyphellophora attinorum TaxID=1664694 RepID=A0A0N0NJZ8_9EURO|nr:uncharacterized protein AB675_10232 [Phialophora attinorum]KPI37468.1 hypothetical protein AB675_10232 [Phialophora attinorum]
MAGSSQQGELVDVEDKLVEVVEWEGREYQKYSLAREINLSPCDQDEADRLEKQHFFLKDLLTGEEWPRNHRLFPAAATHAHDFLDLGFGTGLWCAEVGSYDTRFRVVGIDITSHMAIDDNPPNVELELQNLNEELMLSDLNSFDFVRLSFVSGGISRQRWPGLLSDIFNKALRPGGIVQSMEWDLHFRSDSDAEASLSNLREWTRLYTTALSSSERHEGRKIHRVEDIEDFMRAARFEVSSKVIDVPIGGWPNDRRSKAIGTKNFENMSSLLETIATYVVVSRRICSLEDFKDLIENAKTELGNDEAELYMRLHIVWGKKAA